MSLPAWNDPDLKAGTMVRGALWLLQVVGEDGVFTKEQLREAFSGISQADRRIRDLRSFGWVVLTNTEDARLSADEQRFVSAGLPVWDPSARRAAARKTITAKERREVMARDGYMCAACGIASTESYQDDSNQSAVLSVARREAVLPSGNLETLLITECKRCHAGSDGQPADVVQLLASIDALDGDEREQLAQWVSLGRRGITPVERAWSAYRRLPSDARHSVREALGS